MGDLTPLIPLDEELSPIEKLSDRHRIFVWKYLESLNATTAARAAGYSEGAIGQYGYGLLCKPHIKAAIVYEQTRRLVKYEAASHRIIQELCAVAFVNMQDFYRLDEFGEPILDLSKLTREQWAAIGEITTDYYTEGKGENAREVKRVKVKTLPKTGAIETLIKMLGLGAADRLEVNVNGGSEDIDPKMDARTAAELFRRTRDGK